MEKGVIFTNYQSSFFLHETRALKVLAKSAKIIFDYLFGRWWFGYAFEQLWFNQENKMWVKTSSTHYHGAIFWQNDCFFKRFCPQTINSIWLFVHMPGNKQSILNWLGGSLVMSTVYINKVTIGQLKLRLGL